MGKVNVVIVDATGNKEQKVGLPDDVKCGIIMVKLVEKIKLPSVGPDGNPISYKFIHKVTGRQLLEVQTLGEAGIKDGDVLRLQPEITAGAICPACGEEGGEGAFCVKCGKNMNTGTVASVVSEATVQNDPLTEGNQPMVNSSGVPGGFAPSQTATSYQTQGVKNTIDKIDNITEKGFKFFPKLGMLSGIVSVILGIVTMMMSNGHYESSTSYGGDAYTGIQNAAAQTANNIQDLATIAKFGLGGILIVLGIFAFCYFGIKNKKSR